MILEQINKAVAESGIKQKVLAERIGVSEQTLSAMLTGRRKISAEDFYNICVALRESPNKLMGYAG